MEENTKKIVALSIDDHTIRLPEFKPVPKYQPKQEKSQLKETTTSPEQAYAPYNFVSLDDIVIFYNKDALPRRNSFTGLSGRINLNIETKTPLYIQRTLKEKEVEELTKIEKEENNKDKMREFNKKIYQSFSPASGKYKIPGSSLRGMVRSLYEIATYSKMSFLDDRKLYFRAFADRAKLLQEYYNKRMINEDKNAIPRLKVKAGYLFKSGKDFYINEAENYYRVEEDIDFSYRETKINTIVFEVVFNIEEGFSSDMLKEFTKMRDNQPSVASAGSCFKNPKGDFAGRLIEAVGLKGVKKGDMSFSEQHANFLVNYGEGSFEDAVYLIGLAKNKIKDEFDIEIEEEIILYK